MRLTHRLLDLLIKAKTKKVLLIGPDIEQKENTARVNSYNQNRAIGVKITQAQCFVINPVSRELEIWQKIQITETFETGVTPNPVGRPPAA